VLHYVTTKELYNHGQHGNKELTKTPNIW